MTDKQKKDKLGPVAPRGVDPAPQIFRVCSGGGTLHISSTHYMGPTPFYGARVKKTQKADFAMKQTNICRLSGEIWCFPLTLKFDRRCYNSVYAIRAYTLPCYTLRHDALSCSEPTVDCRGATAFKEKGALKRFSANPETYVVIRRESTRVSFFHSFMSHFKNTVIHTAVGLIKIGYISPVLG